MNLNKNRRSLFAIILLFYIFGIAKRVVVQFLNREVKLRAAREKLRNVLAGKLIDEGSKFETYSIRYSQSKKVLLVCLACLLTVHEFTIEIFFLSFSLKHLISITSRTLSVKLAPFKAQIDRFITRVLRTYGLEKFRKEMEQDLCHITENLSEASLTRSPRIN